MAKIKNKKQTIHNDSTINESFLLNKSMCLVFSIIFGYFYMNHIEDLFENSINFSHLSNLERELSFRTESGLYYYYFKNLIVDSNYESINSSLLNEINNSLINDRRTEYPLIINSLKRFNLYPEIVLAVLYKMFNSVGMLEKVCWTIQRDPGMSAVQSCVGSQEPIYFYVKGL